MTETGAAAEVERADGEARIEGVPTLGWGTGRDCTFAGALEAALAVTDHPCRYADIMGFTGLAFRVRWFVGGEEPSWCPSSAVGEMPEEIDAVGRVTGWVLRFDFMNAEDEATVSRLRREIVASIDAGRPVLAYEPKLNMDVVFGYRDGGDALLLRDYFQPDEPLELAPSELGFLLIFVGDRAEGMPAREALLDSLRTAVRNWRRERFTTGPGEYWYGEAAYVDWISDLGEVESFTEQQRNRLFFVSHWSFSTLLDARCAAVAFLRAHAPLLAGEGGAALERAAGIYEQEVQLLNSASERDGAAFGSLSGGSSDDWPPRVREREQALLAKARELESAAIGEIELALAAADKGVGAETPAAADEYREVVLQEAVANFRRLTGDLAKHQIVLGDTVYPQPCVYLAMHLIELWAAGWKDADFDTLAAVSGASALFAYQPGEFMPKYANLYIGMDDRIAEATGFGYEWVSFDAPEEAWGIITGSIDLGRPLKGWHWENLLIAGYRPAEKLEDASVFVMADGPDTIAEWWTCPRFKEWAAQWPHQLGRHAKRVEKLPDRGIALRVMRDLAEWSADPPKAVREAYPEAKFGLAGIEAYAADCADVRTYEDWSACHDINPQWTLRNSTAAYLGGVAAGQSFPVQVTSRIATAAEHYRAAYEDWREFHRQLAYDAPEGAGKDPERRAAGAAAVRRALEHERAAVAELREALALVE